jgi:UDP-2-acetamido-3-amino-2,3-dideoxy-glucuronate N-acetyltransferase
MNTDKFLRGNHFGSSWAPRATGVAMSDKASWWAHPSAVVDPGAQLGDGTKVWHFAHVMPGARIGRRCSLGQNVFVADGVVIGDGVKIQNNVSVYEGVELGDDVFCGPSMVFTNVVNPRSHVSRRSEYRPTRVGRGATLGANCTIVCGHDVGRFAFVGAGAVVTRDVPDFALVMGVPGRVVGYMCGCGVRLPFESGAAPGDVACAACGSAYRWDGTTLMEAGV